MLKMLFEIPLVGDDSLRNAEIGIPNGLLQAVEHMPPESMAFLQIRMFKIVSGESPCRTAP